jgi:hypothetical protein
MNNNKGTKMKNVAVKTNKVKVTGTKRGRPVIENVSGYKVKVGLRYITVGSDKKFTNKMSEGAVFETQEDAQYMVDELVKSGDIRVWGGTPRAEILPRKTQDANVAWK